MKPKILNEPYEAIIECAYCGGEYTAVISGNGQLVADAHCGKEICWLEHTNGTFREMKRQRDALLEIAQSFADTAPTNDHYTLNNGMKAGELRARLRGMGDLVGAE